MSFVDRDGVDTLSDLEQLVTDARGGDEEAWKELYRSLYPRLLAFARLHLDGEQAADAVSEAMTRAVARIDRFTWKGAGFEAWIFQILRNIVIDTYRRSGRAPRTVEEGSTHQEDESADALLADVEAKAVRGAFQLLSKADQEVLYLRVVQNLGASETAQILGKRPGAVRMAQVRALERLRAALTETGEL